MNFKIIIYRLLFLVSQFIGEIGVAFSQEARVTTFKHIMRWQDESSFPNYFPPHGVLDSINGGIQKYLMRQYNVSRVSFPDKDDYTIITGFGTNYTITEKERKSGKIESSNGQKLVIEMNWITEVTTLTITGDTKTKIVVPLVGQLYNDSALAGNFIFDKQKLSKNKRIISSSGSNIGDPSPKNEEKVEWYPIFMKKVATPDEIASALGILVCLFLGIGNM
jgi:hypothetical protein